MEILIGFLLLQIIFILYLNKLRLVGKFKLTINKIALLSSFLFYIILVSVALFLKYKYQNELDAFDVNKDGFFIGNEISEEQQEAMKNVVSDTGRNFAPITGILISIVYYLFLLPILLIINKINSTFKLKST